LFLLYNYQENGRNPGEVKDPGETSIRNNEMILKNGILINAKQYEKNEVSK